MATKAFNAIYHHRHVSLARRHSIDLCPPASTTNTLFLKPTTTATATTNKPLSHSHSSATLAISSATSFSTPNATTSPRISYDLLEQHLVAKNYREADEETRRLIIVLAGEQAEKRGYVFFSEVQFIPDDDLKTIDSLWRKHSDNRFGYSVQKRIWNKVNKDFTRFFIKVGWMKKLESSEVEQYNYRSFPSEFTWEMDESTPEGHLPLTNALRGTQLLKCILNHPAFLGDGADAEAGDKASGDGIVTGEQLSKKTTAFKPTYTF